MLAPARAAPRRSTVALAPKGSFQNLAGCVSSAVRVVLSNPPAPRLGHRRGCNLAYAGSASYHPSAELPLG
jgi:hypothetical protein